MRSEQSWSLLDPRPVLLYVSNSDEYIVYWNGIAMTHSMALCMAMETIGIYATPEMKVALEKNYRKIYYANGFETRAWDEKVRNGNVYSYLKRIMSEHIKTVTEGKDAKDILDWFDYKRSRSDSKVV